MATMQDKLTSTVLATVAIALYFSFSQEVPRAQQQSVSERFFVALQGELIEGSSTASPLPSQNSITVSDRALAKANR